MCGILIKREMEGIVPSKHTMKVRWQWRSEIWGGWEDQVRRDISKLLITKPFPYYVNCGIMTICRSNEYSTKIQIRRCFNRGIIVYDKFPQPFVGGSKAYVLGRITAVGVERCIPRNGKWILRSHSHSVASVFPNNFSLMIFKIRKLKSRIEIDKVKKALCRPTFVHSASHPSKLNSVFFLSTDSWHK